MADRKPSPRSNWILFVVVSVYLVIQAVWRYTVRADEWPPAMVRNLEIFLDIGMSISAVGLFFQFKDDPAKSGYATLLVIMAVVAIFVIFGIRLGSDVGWWTGHRRNWTG
ncbi:MAG: hypothetical protein O9322_13165 [Beijerinckiaceae bacterium]|nr:hypothetical protein [Beijerinckiaceae bacterium]MCZ8300293.1 hypothetical protein [Beijerinckiaceae bacterium]